MKCDFNYFCCLIASRQRLLCPCFLRMIPLNLHPIKMVLPIEGFAESMLKMQKACNRVIVVSCLFAVLEVTWYIFLDQPFIIDRGTRGGSDRRPCLFTPKSIAPDAYINNELLILRIHFVVMRPTECRLYTGIIETSQNLLIFARLRKVKLIKKKPNLWTNLSWVKSFYNDPL